MTYRSSLLVFVASLSHSCSDHKVETVLCKGTRSEMAYMSLDNLALDNLHDGLSGESKDENKICCYYCCCPMSAHVAVAIIVSCGHCYYGSTRSVFFPNVDKEWWGCTCPTTQQAGPSAHQTESVRFPNCHSAVCFSVTFSRAL